MIRLILASAIFLPSFALFADDDLSPNVKRAIELGEIRRKERIAELEGGLRAMKVQYERMKSSTRLEEEAQKDKVTARKTTEAEVAAKKEKALQNLKERAVEALKEIDSIRSQKYYCPNMTLSSMKVGEIGKIVDPYGTKLTAKVIQIVDDESLIMQVDSEHICLIVDTKDLRVGKKFTLSMAFEVTGTTEYKLPSGKTKKVFVLEQFFFPDA